ncbi:ABC transporter permease subunit [Tessaracoccus sp. HDW20]|uniref:ABC transporter permease subunit n=1 Tax=Tessaracoccus coleopterorum TaxID=2714950 RepID=UPI0018D346FE|nr:ABC transporter permease subunit [Tessaracoccus coleopterorum]NHB85597.1 ABC transporter permease subunit [Tessaracoccus coleopterorum]
MVQRQQAVGKRHRERATRPSARRALLLLALGILAFSFRELRTRAAAPGLRERLQAIPGVEKIVRPTGRGASLLTIRLAAHQVLVGYVTLLAGLVMGLAMPPIYHVLMGAVGDFAITFPSRWPTCSAAVTSRRRRVPAPRNLRHGRTAVRDPRRDGGVLGGHRGEERAGRLSVLLAQPISRTRIYLTVALTAAVYSLIVAGAMFLGTWAGIALARLDVSVANLAATCLLLLLLGWFFGALALLLSAATGRPSVAVWVTTGVAVVGYFGYTLLLAAGGPNSGSGRPSRRT